MSKRKNSYGYDAKYGYGKGYDYGYGYEFYGQNNKKE